MASSVILIRNNDEKVIGVEEIIKRNIRWGTFRYKIQVSISFWDWIPLGPATGSSSILKNYYD
jgi:hypothetical protein